MCIQWKTCIRKKNQKIETGNWVSMSNARKGTEGEWERFFALALKLFCLKRVLVNTWRYTIQQHLTLHLCVCVCVLLSDCHSRVVFLMLDIWLRSLALALLCSLLSFVKSLVFSASRLSWSCIVAARRRRLRLRRIYLERACTCHVSLVLTHSFTLARSLAWSLCALRFLIGFRELLNWWQHLSKHLTGQLGARGPLLMFANKIITIYPTVANAF